MKSGIAAARVAPATTETVEDQLADGWWVLLKQEWVDTRQFKS